MDTDSRGCFGDSSDIMGFFGALKLGTVNKSHNLLIKFSMSLPRTKHLSHVSYFSLCLDVLYGSCPTFLFTNCGIVLDGTTYCGIANIGNYIQN